MASCATMNSFIVLHCLVSCLLLHGPNKSLDFCRLCTHMRFWMSLFNIGSSGEVCSLLRMPSHLVITSCISAGTGSPWSMCHPIGMWCDNNNIYLKSNIQCILRYEFSGLIMIYTIVTGDTHCRNRNIIQII